MGGARRKNAIFLVKNLQKVSTNAILACFFKICPRRRIFGQNRDFLMLCESSENQFARPKRKVDKISNFFENAPPPPPPREKPRSATGAKQG